MTFGLIGNHYWKHICTLKRQLGDRGHRAIFVLPTYFPQYYLSTVGTNCVRLDHIDLSHLDGCYVGLIETRQRFFRGKFSKAIWLSLRERYLEFARCEIENLSFQMSLLLMLANICPCINDPRSLLQARLRLATLRKLQAGGIPVADFGITNQPAPGSHLSKCIRIEEEACYDVPCFPRQLQHCLRLVHRDGGEMWKVMGVARKASQRMVVSSGSSERVEPTPSEARDLVGRILEILNLEVAQVDFIRTNSQSRVVDIHPMPDWSAFEEITGEPVSDLIAQLMIQSGGAK